MSAGSATSPSAYAWQVSVSFGMSSGSSGGSLDGGLPRTATDEWSVLGNPMAIAPDPCTIGSACPQISISANPQWWGQASPPPPSLHWTLDLKVYSYRDIPVSMTAKRTAP